MSEAVADAYRAPFPDREYKAGVRRFPELVMISPEMEGIVESRRALEYWSSEWAGESFMAIGAADPVLGTDVMNTLRLSIRGCPEPLVLPRAGHFVQESGEEIARAALVAFGDV